MAYGSSMDFDDMSGAVEEVARVLEPGAAFCICITHPISDAGGFEGDAGDAPYALRADYFGRQPFEETVVRGGATMTFKGWSRSLESYFSALSSAGFVVDCLREPKPSVLTDDLRRWSRYPMFLHVRAVKRHAGRCD